MRKLVLFGLLGGVFGMALLLERFVTRPAVKVDADSDQLSLVIGGGTPRDLPEIPDAPPPEAGGGGGRKGDPRPGGRPAGGGARGGNEAIAKQRPPSPAPSPKPDGGDADASRAEHVVTKGETLMSIAKAELGATARWHDLAKWNAIEDPAQLKIGSKLRLSAPDDAQRAPAPPKTPTAKPPTTERTHRFAKGDTLSHLAAIYLGDASRWREIQRLNGIPDPAKITEGTTLQLPAR